MNAATVPEWIGAFGIGVAGFLPFVAAMFAAGADLPPVSTEPARDVAERARILLALTRHLETTEATR